MIKSRSGEPIAGLYSTKFDPKKRRLEISIPGHPVSIFSNIKSVDLDRALSNFIVFHTEEKNFIKKYISNSLGSIVSITHFFNIKLGEVIKEVSNLSRYVFNKDETRAFIIASKESLLGNNTIFGELIDTNNGETLLSLDNVTTASFLKKEGFDEKLIAIINSNEKREYDAKTGKPYTLIQSSKNKSPTKSLSLWDKMRFFAYKVGGKALADFFRVIQNKGKKSSIEEKPQEAKLQRQKSKDEDYSEFKDSPDAENDEFIMTQEEALQYGTSIHN